MYLNRRLYMVQPRLWAHCGGRVIGRRPPGVTNCCLAAFPDGDSSMRATRFWMLVFFTVNSVLVYEARGGDTPGWYSRTLWSLIKTKMGQYLNRNSRP